VPVCVDPDGDSFAREQILFYTVLTVTVCRDPLIASVKSRKDTLTNQTFSSEP
jgi:hypothetical protein